MRWPRTYKVAETSNSNPLKTSILILSLPWLAIEPKFHIIRNAREERNFSLHRIPTSDVIYILMPVNLMIQDI